MIRTEQAGIGELPAPIKPAPRRTTAAFDQTVGLRRGDEPRDKASDARSSEEATVRRGRDGDPATSTASALSGVRTDADRSADGMSDLNSSSGAGRLYVDSSLPECLSGGSGLGVDAGTLVNVHVQVGGQFVETIDVAWTLAATGRLSQRNAALLLPGTSAASAKAAFHVGAFGAEQGVSSAAAALTSGADMQGTRLSEATSTLRAGHWTPAVAESDSSAAAKIASAMEAREWHERLLKWIDRPEGMVLFVRDYRLDDTSAEALSRRLRETARQAGLKLHRIVINGAAVWQAPQWRHDHAG